MIANRVSGSCNPSYQLWVPLGSLTKHEERGSRRMPFKDIEQTRGKFRMRPIVKRQRSDRILGQDMSNGSHHVSPCD
jgi:hypothetical protein